MAVVQYHSEWSGKRLTDCGHRPSCTTCCQLISSSPPSTLLHAPPLSSLPSPLPSPLPQNGQLSFVPEDYGKVEKPHPVKRSKSSTGEWSHDYETTPIIACRL